MRNLFLVIILFCSSGVIAQTYRVSELKFDNFKAYEQYGISGDNVRAVLRAFSREYPQFERSKLFVLAARLAEVYRAQGLVFHRVEVELGQPTRLRMIPGVLTAVDVRGNRRYSGQQLSVYFDDMFGGLVDSNQMAEAMTRMNSLPGLSSISFLSFGRLPGDAVLNVNVTEESWGQLTTRFNNYGTATTGDYRLSTQLTLNNPLKRLDQWRIGASISDSTANWAANLAVDTRTRKGLVWGVSGQYQAMVLSESFELLNMSGWQGNGALSLQATPVDSLNRTFNWSANVGYLQQSLHNDANLSFLDIDIKDVPAELSLGGDFAGNRSFLGYQFKTKAGYLLSHEGPVELDTDYWALSHAELSFAQSITGGVLQQGIDISAKLQGQYAMVDLPSHRRFGLSGPSKLGAYQNGTVTADTAVFGELGLRLINLSLGPLQVVVQGNAQTGWGQTADTTTDLLSSFGGSFDLYLGPFNSQVSLYTDETFETLSWWFDVTLNWPEGK